MKCPRVRLLPVTAIALLVPAAFVSELQGLYQLGAVGEQSDDQDREARPAIRRHVGGGVGREPGENVIVDGLQRVRTGIVVAPTPYKATKANAVGGGN